MPTFRNPQLDPDMVDPETTGSVRIKPVRTAQAALPSQVAPPRKGLLATMFGGGGGGGGGGSGWGSGLDDDPRSRINKLGALMMMLDPMSANAGTSFLQLEQNRATTNYALKRQNETASWLKTQGLGDREASYLASDPEALRGWYTAWQGDKKPDWQIHKVRTEDDGWQETMIDMKHPEKRQPIGAVEYKDPQVVAPGSTLYDHKNQPVFTAPADPNKPPEQRTRFDQPTNRNVSEQWNPATHGWDPIGPAEAVKPPQTRERFDQASNRKITEEWNPATNAWDPKGPAEATPAPEIHEMTDMNHRKYNAAWNSEKNRWDPIGGTERGPAPITREEYDPVSKQKVVVQWDWDKNDWTKTGGIAEPQKAPDIKSFHDKQGMEYEGQWNPATQKWDQVDGTKAPTGMTLSVGPDGTVTLVQGDKSTITEPDKKSLNYISRMEAAKKDIATFTPHMRGAKGFFNTLTERFAPEGTQGFMQTEGYQRGHQAGDLWLMAVLRGDSGAVLKDEEIARYGRIFLPQPGDSDEMIAQRERSRDAVERGLKSGLSHAAAVAMGEDVFTGAKKAPDTSAPALTPEQYRLAPSGTPYLAPDGSTRRKR